MTLGTLHYKNIILHKNKKKPEEADNVLKQIAMEQAKSIILPHVKKNLDF